MTTSTPPDLGTFIPSGQARRIVYGAYTVGAVAVGAVAAYFVATGHPLPEPVVGAQGVVAYLGIPIGALALANARGRHQV